tara:strand:- start:490 stop:894 length:405 start_codon:yes stop_codon:yes gene_type:complete
MSVQLALLKSGEEVIADIKEYRNSDDELVSYLFKDPFSIKIKTSQVLIEGDGAPKHDVVYYRWMSLSKDSDIIVNKDWIVCITDPLDSIKQSYEEKMNGRGSDDSNESSSRRGSGGTSDSGIVLNESSETSLPD